jgi:lipopolysaccharide/colanic/teichoic acid biosynthesis glycosyltransferase
MLVISGIIRLCSPGPVLFRQERIGLRGTPFVCLKFRTMHVQADTQSHQAYLEKLISSPAPMKKLDAEGDKRIFAFGRLLRASGLDELPQLINVLRGEMSLVGPRPCIRYEYERFKPEHMERFNTVPGLTGLWQVSGKNKTTFQEMIDLDIAYSRHLSFTRDVRILCRTFPVVFEQTFELANRQVSRNGNHVRSLRNQGAAKSVASL